MCYTPHIEHMLEEHKLNTTAPDPLPSSTGSMEDQALQALPTEFLADTGREDNGAAESENYWDVRF